MERLPAQTEAGRHRAILAGEPRMTSTTIAAAGPGLLAEETAGPLEQRHLRYANYRALAGLDRIKTAYTHAVAAGYRFLSYGEACLIERPN